MYIILITLLAFVIPVLIILGREWKKKKEEEAKGVVRKKEPLNPAALVRITIVLLIMLVPALVLSDLPGRFYSANDSGIKIAFKHTGKRKVDCDEVDLIKKAGERYRRQLQRSKQVVMQVEGLSGCPRERHPVSVELYVDGKRSLDKSYAPTGLKKDMASYIYEEFIIAPGPHTVSVKLYDRGNRQSPDYALENTVTFKPREVKVIWFNDKSNSLLME